MNKSNLIKKIVLYAFVIFYDILSLFWCYIITNNFVYNLTKIQGQSLGSNIKIIGGADLPTWSFTMGAVFGIAFSVLFVILSLATVFLFTILAIRKQTNRKFNILLCIFSALTLIIYMLIPAQTYAVSLYVLIRKLSFFKYIQFIYIIISLIIIVTNILFTIKRSNKTQ